MQREISQETSTRARERPCNSISRCKNDEWMIGRVKLHSTVPTQTNSFGLVVAKRRTLTTYHIFFAICDSSFFSICIALVCGYRFWTFCTGNIYPKRHIFQGTDMALDTIQFSEWLTFKKQFFSFFKSRDTFSLLKHLSCMYNLYIHLFSLPHQLTSNNWWYD